MLVARLVSPISFPRKASESPSHPAARAIAAQRASANFLNKLWKSGDKSPQGPATSLPCSSPPRALNLERRGPGGGSRWPALAGAAPRNLTSRSRNVLSYSASSFSAHLSVPFPAVPRGNQVLPALMTFSSARQLLGPSGVGRRKRKSGTFPCLARAM